MAKKPTRKPAAKKAPTRRRRTPAKAASDIVAVEARRPITAGSRAPVVRILRASFDSAQTTDENSRHWANADGLSPDAAASSAVRQTIRNRARYEVANNSIARGIVVTLANDLVGSGPRLQLLIEGQDEVNHLLETEFGRWCRATRLAAKLRTLRMARAQDGEGFGVLFTNPNIDHPVKLDVQLIESDRVSSPLSTAGTDPKFVDGIRLDDYGNPLAYSVRTQHPGDSGGSADTYATVPAANMIHWFRADRPEQHRGLPDIMPALSLFAQLRRFTKATLTSAETAADLSLVMKTTSPAGGEAAEVDPWVTMDLERNAAMFAPEGWEPTQMKAEHPNEMFEGFRKAIINEIARCLGMPYNIAAGNSAEYNYASGRLDHQAYFKGIDVDRSDLELVGMDPIFAAWLAEALRVPEFNLFGHVERIYWPRLWMWPGREHVDPMKEARAADVLLKSGLLTEAEYMADKGLDWQEQQEQRRREAEGRKKRGLPPLVPEKTGAPS